MALNLKLPMFGGGHGEPEMTKEAAQVVAGLHGKHYEAAARGQAFFGSSASAGIALIIPATTGNHPTLWNPSGSGVNLSIIRAELAWASGTHAPGALEWAVTHNAGSTHGTGATVVTATKVDPEPCLIGAAANSKAIWSPTVNTFLAAPVFLRTTGIALATTVVTATEFGAVRLTAEYDGDFLLAPDTAISLCSENATTTALFQITVIWEEIPL